MAGRVGIRAPRCNPKLEILGLAGHHPAGGLLVDGHDLRRGRWGFIVEKNCKDRPTSSVEIIHDRLFRGVTLALDVRQ